MTEVAGTVLRRGDHSLVVRELQDRLRAAGFAAPAAGTYEHSTETAVRAFQRARGIHIDGVCGPETWGALVESAYRLGDRFLYLRRPNLRGDDIADLQRRLNALGFDAGREDGILGSATETALRQFQRHAGVESDGVCGPATRVALGRVGKLAAGSVASVRERDRLRRGVRRLQGHRIYLAADPALSVVAMAAARGLRSAGATVVVDSTGDDAAVLAAEAGRFGADLFLALATTVETLPQVAYFANQAFRSEAGYCVAHRLAEALAPLIGSSAQPVGRTYRMLRETLMPAAVCELLSAEADAADLAHRAGDLAGAIVTGVRRGVEEPFVLPR